MKQPRIVLIKWIAFVVATTLVIFTIFIIPRLNKKMPDIPSDELHIRVTKINECIYCHIEAGNNPLPQNHAAKKQCLYCHKMKHS